MRFLLLCFIYVSCFTYGTLILIYIMRLFMVYVFYFMFVKSRSLLCFTCIFHTWVYVFVKCFRNIQVNSVVAIAYFGN